MITTKHLLESAHAAHLEAQEQTLVAALTLDIENLVSDELLNRAEEELQQVVVSVANTKGFDEARSHIKKYNKSMKCLKVQLSI